MINWFSGQYSFLSNFHKSTIELYGVRFPTVEHAFQSYKMVTAEHAELVRNCDSPGLAKKTARALPMRQDWNDIRLGVMRTCVYVKFQQNNYLRQKLIETGTHQLVEGNTWGDTFWGVYAGRGENHLGKILMDVRQYLT